MDLTSNLLVRPPFAVRGSARIQLDSRSLALVLAIVMTLASLFFLIGLPVTVTLCRLPGCSFPTVRTLGVAMDLAGALVATGGCVLMYRLNPAGRALAVYGLVVLALGGVVALIGNDIFVAANSTFYTAGAGAAIFLVVQLVAVALIYCLVVVSRAPVQPPAVADRSYGDPGAEPLPASASTSIPLSTEDPRTPGSGRTQSTSPDPADPG